VERGSLKMRGLGVLAILQDIKGLGSPVGVREADFGVHGQESSHGVIIIEKRLRRHRYGWTDRWPAV